MLFPNRTRTGTLIRAAALAGLAALSVPSAVRGETLPPGAGRVGYSTNLKLMQGDMPFTGSYTLTVTAPSNLPIGTTSVGFEVDVTNLPAFLDEPTALSYLHFSKTSLSFTKTAPDQLPTDSVVITLGEVPLGTQALQFGYQIKTTGWPGEGQTIIIDDPETGLPVEYPVVRDDGTAINVALTVPEGAASPAVVEITFPTDATPAIAFDGVNPVTFPVTFHSTSTDRPITSVYLDIDGHAVDLSGATITGLGSFVVDCTVSVTLSAGAAAGSHLLTAFAYNGASVDGRDTQGVAIVFDPSQMPPLTIAVSSPTEGQVIPAHAGGVTPVTILAQGGTSNGQLNPLTASLFRFVPPGIELPVVTNYSLSSTGDHGVMDIFTSDTFQLLPGDYRLVVTVSDTLGRSLSLTRRFSVVDLPPPPACYILWLPPVSLDIPEMGGAQIPIKFKLICPDCGCGDAGDPGNGEGHGSVDNVADTSILVDVREGSTTTTFSYTGKKNSYSINGIHYQLNFKTAKGTHVYTVEVYRLVDGVKQVLDSKVVRTK